MHGGGGVKVEGQGIEVCKDCQVRGLGEMRVGDDDAWAESNEADLGFGLRLNVWDNRCLGRESLGPSG